LIAIANEQTTWFGLIPEILVKRMLRDVSSNKIRNFQEFFVNE
jgi:hypothetical protein